MRGPSYTEARGRLVEELRGQGVTDQRVLEAIGSVPREYFVRPEHVHRAYENEALPSACGQTISQPLVVALTLQALRPQGHETVLEIGTGTGYQATLLGRLVARVVSIERQLSLATRAQARLRALEVTNVEVHVADGTLGWPPAAPYDAIVVGAAAQRVPRPLLDQLHDPGRLVIPLGAMAAQQLVCLHQRQGQIEHASLGPVRFVPLVGATTRPGAAREGDYELV